MTRSQPGTAAAVLLGTVVFLIPGVGVGADEIQPLFQAFLEKPSKGSYLKVFEAVISHPKYDPYSNDLHEIGQLVKKGQFKEAQAKLDESIPNLLLSPRAHLKASLAAEGLGNADKAAQQQGIAVKCIEGILSTGNGSKAAPYVVARPSDEYDVLRHLGRKRAFREFSKPKPEGKPLDIWHCADNAEPAEVHFDITAPYEKISRRLRRE